jgi:predicted transcriptional regulator
MGEVKRFIPKQQRIQTEIAASIAEQLALFGLDQLPEQPREAILNALHRYTHNPNAEGLWPGGFTMLSRTQTAAIWKAIRELPADDRPGQVRHAFDLALLNLRQDTGEIMLTRDQLAEEIGCAPKHVSTIMGTLEQMGVIRRERRKIERVQGRGMAVYFVNPNVAWNGDLTTRQREAAKQPLPLLTLMQGGREPSPAT